MKLLQLNIWQGRLLRQILELIDQVEPDLLCLQEVFSSEHIITPPERMFRSLEEIQQQTGYRYVYFSPSFSATYAGAKASFGNAIISRFPLVNTETIYTNGGYIPDYKPDNYEINNRNLQLAEVRPDGKPAFLLANHHAHWDINPLGNATSLAKMKIVKSALQKTSLPVIFSGDLNVIGASKSMRVFDGFLNDLTTIHHIRSTLSPLGKATNVACDHVLVSPNVQINSFEVLSTLVSDHKALVADFSLQV